MPRAGAVETEDEVARAVRLETIAAAVQAETRSVYEAAVVAATIEHESQNFRYDVHAGRRRGDSGRARCLGQVWEQAWLPPAEHRRLVGVDYASTARCVRAIVTSYDRIRCATLVGELSTYAAGKGCRFVWSGAAERAARVAYYVSVIKSDLRSVRSRKARV